MIGGTATFASANAGNNISVTVSGLSLSGADASDYLLSSTSVMTTANITQAVLTVTAASYTTTVGSAVIAYSYSISGFVGTDTSSVVSGFAILSSNAPVSGGMYTTAGTYSIIVNLGTLSAANYTFVAGSGILNVQPPQQQHVLFL